MGGVGRCARIYGLVFIDRSGRIEEEGRGREGGKKWRTTNVGTFNF
jgi:hypothetical protein